MHPLNDKWVLWFHNPNDTNWDFSSYMNVYEINSIETFWDVFNNINKSNVENGMFFMMRKDIKPLWEDDKNKEGGCWSFKILKKNIFDSWLDVCVNCVNETLARDSENINLITGISISPKKSFCIIKIWNNDKNKNSKDLINNNLLNLNLKESLYKAHSNR
jgi:hypothetical protein